MMTLSRRQALVLGGSALALAAFPLAAFAQDATQAARAFIEQSAAQVRAEATQVKAGGNARSQFARRFADSFDAEALSRAVLGTRWTALSPAQQKEFRAAFESWVAKSYADRFYTYAGQPMTIASAEPVAGGMVLVKTRVTMPGSSNQTMVDWLVSNSSGTSRIADVTIDGVSLTRTQRDEFSSVIQANGGDVGKLTAMLEERSR
jgi:phospholipid transport system substrate-binding protein